MVAGIILLLGDNYQFYLKKGKIYKEDNFLNLILTPYLNILKPEIFEEIARKFLALSKPINSSILLKWEAMGQVTVEDLNLIFPDT